MKTTDIPKTIYCHMGGSGTWGCNFPEDLHYDGVSLLRSDMEFDTPFGVTVPMKLFRISSSLTADGKDHDVIYVPFHGWMGMSPYEEHFAERIFWVLREAGVKYIMADGSGGGVNMLLEPGDVICPSDCIDYTRRPYYFGKFCPYSIRMNEIVNPAMRKILFETASRHFNRVFRRGVYGVMEAPRFETAAEVVKLRMDGVDIAAHTMMPEAALARAIGASYASIYIISNHAEGFLPDWEESIFDIYERCAPTMSRVMIEAMAAIDPEKTPNNAEENIIKMPEHVQKRIKLSK